MNNKSKLIMILSTIIFLLLFHSIAYSAIASTMTIKGDAYARVDANIRITDFEINSTTSSALSSYEEFNKEQLESNITLPNADSTITYKVEVTNYGSAQMGVYSITGIPENLTYELTDYTLKEKVCDETSKCTLGAKKTFYMTIKYKNYDAATTNYNINLTFDYKVVYDVTYKNMTNNNFPSQVVEGESININIIEKLYYPHITIGSTKLNYNQYTYSDGNLIINNITNNVEINLTKIINYYDYTGTSQTFIAPESGTYKIELWGAGSSGKGGYTSGEVALTQGTELYIYVGEYGYNTEYVFNGGGGGNRSGTTGGGATDVRLVSGEWNDFESLKSRIMIAAGGGGSSHGGEGGPGGGLIGYDGIPSESGYTGADAQGFGATQTAGGEAGTFNWSGEPPTSGTFGIGGIGNSQYGGGGGGGYYGGGGSGVSKSSKGGGAGGSSFISGHNGCVAITEDSTSELITHKTDSTGTTCADGTTDITCSYHYSNYIFKNTTMIDGFGYSWTTEKGESVVGIPTTFDGTSTEEGHAGNGYVKISLLSTSPNVVDSSGNNNYATSTNVTYTEEGATFDGESSYIEIPTTLNLEFPVTYAFKVKFNELAENSTQANGVVFGDVSTKAGFGYRYTTQGYVLNIGSYATYVASSEGMDFGEFYTYHIVYNTINDNEIYRDGEKLSRTTETNYWTWTSPKSFIGKRVQGEESSNSFLNGAIEYFAIYDKALSEKEISQNIIASTKSDIITDQIKLFYYFK